MKKIDFYAEANEPGVFETDIYKREQLRPGTKLNGPLIVEQMDTTIMVLPDRDVEIDAFGNMIINNS